MECYSSLNRSDIVYLDPLQDKEKVLEAFKVSNFMLQKTCLKGLWYYTGVNLFYLFNEKLRYYKPITASEIELLVF